MIKRELIEDLFSREIEFKGVWRELKIPAIDKIISIVGPRRAGKTWYFYSLLGFSKGSMYLNFEDMAFRDLAVEEIFNVIKIFTEIKYPPKTLFLDEVQVIKNWEIMARSLYDRGYKIFLTGSSSKLLPKEISTELRGRALTYILLPFNFREYLTATKSNVNLHTFEGKGKILKLLKEYLRYGGYPEVTLSENRERILKEYFDEIFYKDFVERHKIKSLEFGRFLFEFSFQNFSKEISLKKIKNLFGRNISDKTLYTYVGKLQDTLTTFFVERYSESVYSRSSWPKKIYVCDVGISTILGFSEDMGKRMENFVFLELLRRKNEDPCLEIYYWKGYQGKEVDFVVKRGVKVERLIQVCYDVEDYDTKQREIKALVKASKELRCKNLVTITWDYEDELKINGREIRFTPLWKWSS